MTKYSLNITGWQLLTMYIRWENIKIFASVLPAFIGSYMLKYFPGIRGLLGMLKVVRNN